MLVLLMFSQNFARPIRDTCWNSSKTSDLDSITPIGRSGFNRAQENDAVFRFLHGDMKIANSRKQLCQFGEFMIMGRENRLRPDFGLNVFDYGPCQRKSVECGGSTANLI